MMRPPAPRPRFWTPLPSCTQIAPTLPHRFLEHERKIMHSGSPAQVRKHVQMHHSLVEHTLARLSPSEMHRLLESREVCAQLCHLVPNILHQALVQAHRKSDTWWDGAVRFLAFDSIAGEIDRRAQQAHHRRLLVKETLYALHCIQHNSDWHLLIWKKKLVSYGRTKRARIVSVDWDSRCFQVADGSQTFTGQVIRTTSDTIVCQVKGVEPGTILLVPKNVLSWGTAMRHLRSVLSADVCSHLRDFVLS